MANRFWVPVAGNSSGTWDGTTATNWSATSGGAGGASAPTAADDVFLNASSIGTSGFTVTLASGAVCRSIDCTGWTKTISHPASVTWNIGDGTAGTGNNALKFVSGMTYSIGAAATSLIQFVSTSATVQTFDFAGRTTGSVTFNGAGGSWQLTGSAWGTLSGGVVSVVAGTLNTNDITCNWNNLTSSVSTTRTLTLGASSITIFGSGTCWQMSTVTGLTFNAGTSTILFNNTAAGLTIQTGGRTFNHVSFTTTQSVTIAGTAWTIGGNLSFIPSSGGGNPGLLFTTSGTISGNFTASNVDAGGTSGRVVVAPAVFNSTASQVTVTCNGTVSFTNCDFHCINAAGTSIPWTGTGMGDGRNNSNITFDAVRTVYRVVNGGNWQSNAAWALSTWPATAVAGLCPRPQDTVIFDANTPMAAGPVNVSLGLRFLGRDIDMSACPNSPNLNLGTFNPGSTGSLKLPVGSVVTASTVASWTLLGGAACTIQSNGTTWGTNARLTISAGTGSYTLLGALSGASTEQLNHNSGGFDTNGFGFTWGLYSGSNANTRSLTGGTSVWNLTGTGVVFNISNFSGLTLSMASATINVTDTSASSKTFEFRSGTIGTVNFTGGGAGAIIFGGQASQTATYGTLTFGAPKTYTLAISGTLAVTNPVFQGSAGNVVTLQSSSAGSQTTLSKSSGVVSADYLALKDTKVQGGASWYAGTHSTDNGNNTGWFFTAPPSGGVMAFFR